MMITLSFDEIEWCEEYGRDVVEYYNTIGEAHARALSRYGIDKNPIEQSDCKMAECVYAKWDDQDALKAVKWTVLPVDRGWDVLTNEQRIDVKKLKWNYNRLIWPHMKPDDMYLRKEVDFFVAVRMFIERAPKGARTVISAKGLVEKWVSKDDFFQNRHFWTKEQRAEWLVRWLSFHPGKTEADAAQEGMIVGTPYMDLSELEPMSTFPPRKKAAT